MAPFMSALVMASSMLFDAVCQPNCQPLWSYATGDTINSSPAVANGIVYVGSDDHSLYAFDASCQKKLSTPVELCHWRYD